jgi:uncharacterized membrane protein
MIAGVLLLIIVLWVFWARIAALTQRVRQLEQSLAQHESAAPAPAPPVATVAIPDADFTQPSPFDVVDQSAPAPAPEPAQAPAPATAQAWTPAPAPEPVPDPVAVRLIKEYFTGGNLVVRVGIIVLFFGVAFLLKYAAEHSHLTIETRLIGVAIGGLALFVIGWRLRERRRGFSLALQGGAVGILYLTVFAAFRLYHLVPAGYAFALLAVLGAASGLLALKQDSLSFAMLGAAGGFLAPILASTGQGSHVVLFSYYALLDLGIVWLAWHKTWRPLNLLAFAFTFAIGTFWGVTRYVPAQFASTEPFLVFFFLAFIAIAILFAFQRAPQLNHYVDGTLVFGTPVIAMGLQMALIADVPYGRAYSALAGAAIYLALAWWLHRTRRDTLRLLVESFLALGIALLTLAVPLALDGHWAAATWALEGVAILWMGLRQQRRLALAAGTLLQLGAAVAFMVTATHSVVTIPILNSHCLGALFISVAGLLSARQLRRPTPMTMEQGATLSNIFLVWGLLWWLFAGVSELKLRLPASVLPGAYLGLCAVTAVLAGSVAQRQQWGAMRVPALLILPLMVLMAVYWLLNESHPSAHYGWVAWPVGFAAVWISLWMHESGLPQQLAKALHLAALWLLSLLASWEVYWWLQRWVPESGVWAAVAWALPPAALFAALSRRVLEQRWPVRAQPDTYWQGGALGLAVILGAWMIWINVMFDGSARPLPYVPLLNPLDIAVALVVLLALGWLRALWAAAGESGDRTGLRFMNGMLAALVFFWLNGVLLRTLHQWLGIPHWFETLMAATEVQTALSIFWTLLALGAMLWANRSAMRLVWFAGAALMGVVVAKLFIVDLARIGTVPRIVSFVGVGVLMLVIGYYSPLPPQVKGERA